MEIKGVHRVASVCYFYAANDQKKAIYAGDYKR